MNLVRKHPNASLALFSTVGLGTLVTHVAAHFGWHMTTQEGLYVAGGITTALLFIGRNGAIGTWRFVKRIVLHGTDG